MAPEHALLLLEVLRHPASLAQLRLAEWEVLIPQARRALLLSRLAVQAEQLGLTTRLPAPVQPHLVSARQIATRHDHVVRWEVNRIQRALRAVETPIVLLKGAAYLLAGCETARGRLYGDLDIMVVKDALPEVEQALRHNGWLMNKTSSYHAAYFRRWLHELPPLQHRDRNTVLDVHHTILPLTDRLRVDPQLLLDAAIAIDGDRLMVLAPPDMVLHSAAHLFRNGDFTHGLRDLADMDNLLREYGQTDAFWEALCQRAIQLDLTLPCYWALRYSAGLFQTPLPPHVKRYCDTWQPMWPSLAITDRLVQRAILPRTLDTPDLASNLAINLLSHWPIPRCSTMATSLFWAKRLPWWRRHQTAA